METYLSSNVMWSLVTGLSMISNLNLSLEILSAEMWKRRITDTINVLIYNVE